MSQLTFFTGPEALEALSQRGDPLPRLGQTIDFEAFRSELERALYKPAKGPGGAPRWDAVLMFKLLVLQRLHNLSDEQAEFQVRDRVSFRRFLGLSLVDPVPGTVTNDASTSEPSRVMRPAASNRSRYAANSRSRVPVSTSVSRKSHTMRLSPT